MSVSTSKGTPKAGLLSGVWLILVLFVSGCSSSSQGDDAGLTTSQADADVGVDPVDDVGQGDTVVDEPDMTPDLPAPAPPTTQAITVGGGSAQSGDYTMQYMLVAPIMNPPAAVESTE